MEFKPSQEVGIIQANSLGMARASTLVTGYRWASGPVGLQIRPHNKARVANPRQQVGDEKALHRGEELCEQ
ncbi:hypothetical protein SAMN05421739_10341 [Pontibacter chinhatensis]|uniref:Uncharacterized protein n=1 Tax=Pontibacter chinhatensis TaxID=1436961 RepID=A0A1I2T9Y9_9BACT|nr:hypothetical protein SAMN05421739_10341 [Pontibacter chinhatensis]